MSTKTTKSKENKKENNKLLKSSKTARKITTSKSKVKSKSKVVKKAVSRTSKASMTKTSRTGKRVLNTTTRKSINKTPNHKTYLEIVEITFHDLFAPSGRQALLNYSTMSNLIDKEVMNVHLDQLNKMAMFILVFLGVMAGSLGISSFVNSYRQVVYANTINNVKSERDLSYVKTSPRVRGVKVQRSTVNKNNKMPACSFEIEGKLYSNGAVYTYSNKANIMVCAKLVDHDYSSWHVLQGNRVDTLEEFASNGDYECAPLEGVSNNFRVFVNVSETTDIMNSCYMDFASER